MSVTRITSDVSTMGVERPHDMRHASTTQTALHHSNWTPSYPVTMTASSACKYFGVSHRSLCCGSLRQLYCEFGEFVNFTFDTLDFLFLFCLGKLLIIFQRHNFALQALEFPSETLLFCLLHVSASLVLIDVLLEACQIIIESTK